jgi:hypothetical protein
MKTKYPYWRLCDGSHLYYVSFRHPAAAIHWCYDGQWLGLCLEGCHQKFFEPASPDLQFAKQLAQNHFRQHHRSPMKTRALQEKDFHQ